LNTNPQIVEGLTKAKEKIVSSFGASAGSFSSGSDYKGATIFDVYEEWQRTERVKYHLRLTDIQIIKNRLIKNATVTDLQRMFRREMREAAQAFNFRYYDLAEMSFAEIRKSYQNVGEMDDVMFYQAESNYMLGRFNKAEEIFKDIINTYPASSLAAATYTRLIDIANHFERYSDAVDLFRQMQNIISTTDEYYGEALLLAINAALNGGFYEEAVNLSYEITPASPLYEYARFIQAKALAGAQNLEEANKVLESILKTENLDPQFRFDVLAKLGFVQYDLGAYTKAISYFDQIGVQYANYDRVLMGFSWACYSRELAKTERNFEEAKKYINTLIDEYPNSEYDLEAHTLLGYINQLEFNTSGAISNFRFAFNAKDIKELSDNLNEQQEGLQQIVETANSLERKAMEEKNIEAFNRAVKMREKVEEPLFKLKYADLSPIGMAATNEISRLKGQIQELDRLKQIAIEKNDDAIVDRIEEMQLKIYRAINSYPIEKSSVLGFNYFDEHPLARKESVVEGENNKLANMRSDSEKEREQVIRQIAQLDVEIYNAKTRRDYKKLANLEISRDRFVNLLNKMDYLNTWVYSMKMHDTNINLARWSDYGAFGLANVNFAIRNIQKEQIGDMRDQIQKINDLLIRRKENIEHTIKQIASEISLMTRRVRRQERVREREELNRQFEESYFDTHETEQEAPQEDNLNTLPPSFDEDEK
jgi:TolA-binding protein